MRQLRASPFPVYAKCPQITTVEKATARAHGGPTRRNGPETSLPFESVIELVDVIWHLFPVRVVEWFLRKSLDVLGQLGNKQTQTIECKKRMDDRNQQ